MQINDIRCTVMSDQISCFFWRYYVYFIKQMAIKMCVTKLIFKALPPACVKESDTQFNGHSPPLPYPLTYTHTKWSDVYGYSGIKYYSPHFKVFYFLY